MSVVQTGAAAGASPQSIAFTNPVASGNLLVAATCDIAASSTIPTITNSGTNTWTQVVAQQQTTNNYVVSIFSTTSTVSGSDTIISTSTGSSVALGIFEVNGVSATNPRSGIGLDNTGAAVGSGALTASLTVGANDFCVVIAETNNGSGATTVAGMTFLVNANSRNIAYSAVPNTVSSPSNFNIAWPNNSKSLMCGAVFLTTAAAAAFFPSSSKKLVRKAARRRL